MNSRVETELQGEQTKAEKNNKRKENKFFGFNLQL